MGQVQRALLRHKEGVNGALLIKGVHGSGKTTLSQYIVDCFFKKANTFWLNAPINGSAQPEDFLTVLRKAVGSEDDLFGILNDMPPESVIVINDLELWWERSNTGYGALKSIMDLVNIYGGEILFIINCNIHAYSIINKVFPIEDNFISVIECAPFNTKQLQYMVMSRHKSSGIAFR